MSQDKPLVIGLVCDDSLERPDGVQQYVRTLGAWLGTQGHEVHYITSETQDASLPHLHSLGRLLKVRFNGNRLGVPLPVGRARVINLFAGVQFDVLHVQMPYSPLLAGRLITHAPAHTAIVGTFHIFPHSAVVSYGARFLRLLQGNTNKRFAQIISVSEPARKFAEAAFRLNSSVVPNMVDCKRFAAAVAPISGGDQVTITFLGRLVPRKGSLQLLKAINHIVVSKLTQTPFRVRIGGKGPLKTTLQQYIRQHKLSQYVQLDDFISEADKPAYLAAADIACFPSTGGESFGISLIEAMAASPGVVLAGDNPGYRSVMDTATDQIVNPDDTLQFAEVLAAYIDSPEMRAHARAWQRQHVKQFDTESVGKRVIEVYTAAIRKQKGQ